MRVLGRILGRLFLFLVIAGIAGGIAFAAMTVSQAPDLSEVDVTPEGYLTTVADKDGNTLTTLAGVEANRVYVDLDQIPSDLQNAFVAIEDARFYSHHGVDLKGIARAFVKGVLKGFKFSEGASTITQQLLKNNVFTDWTEESGIIDRVTRKIQEQYLALRLEQREDKETILEYYLNTINLGGGTWGVQAASKRYFGKDVSQLTLSESSVIAGITKNPSSYNPLTHPDKCRERQKLVLDAMLKQEYITQEEYDEAWADDVFARIEENHTDANADVFSYFEDALIQQVLEDLQTELYYTEDEAWDKIYRGGLTICSTEDAALQAIAEEEINNSEWYDSDAQASLVLMDVDTGAVLALVGGRGEKTASLVLNRATDSIRQPGSTIKILGEYAAALETGALTLGSSLDDAPYAYSNGTEIHDSDGEYRGMTTVRTSIVKSLNITALKAFQMVGLDRVWMQLNSFGISTLTEADQVEALALGGTSGGVTNWEMTAAYNAIANNGVYTKPYLYTKVIDHDGNVILRNDPETRQVVREETAALLTSAMEDVMTEGTGVRADFDGYALAGKSGTTTSSRDVWFIGYSTDVTCGVWGGFDDNSVQDNGNYVKYIWKAVMQKAAKLTGAGETFSCTDSLETAVICTKCGNLAVSGLCDSTVQGDVTAVEKYAQGTAPTKTCTCHVAVEICSESGQRCGTFCPSGSRTSRVYLLTGSAETPDVDAIAPADDGTTCQTHTHIWDVFGGNGDGSTQETEPSGNSGGSWWDSFLGGDTNDPEADNGDSWWGNGGNENDQNGQSDREENDPWSAEPGGDSWGSGGDGGEEGGSGSIWDQFVDWFR